MRSRYSSEFTTGNAASRRRLVYAVFATLALFFISLVLIPETLPASSSATSGVVPTPSLAISGNHTISLSFDSGQVFGISDAQNLVIETTNYSGAKLFIAPSVGESTDLVNTEVDTVTIPSIADTATADFLRDFSTVAYGLSTDEGTTFIPVTDGGELYTTNAATDSTTGALTLTLGAKVLSTTPAGTYTNTFILTAVANPALYNVTFNNNAGEDTVTNMPSGAQLSGADIVLPFNPAPTRTGYKFLGWDADQNATEPTYTIDGTSSFPIDPELDSSANSYALYAIWGCGDGYICYDDNGATAGQGTMPQAAMQSSAYAGGASVTLVAPNYSKTGYGFAGWNTEADGSGTNYGPNQTITMPSSGSLWLYANWKAAETTVTLQTFDVADYSSQNEGFSLALRDERDDNVYVVTKLKDGNFWITENLRLVLGSAGQDGNNKYITGAVSALDGSTVTALTSNNTNNPTSTFTLQLTAPASSNSFCDNNNSACIDRITFNSNNVNRSLTASPTANNNSSSWYAYGVVYNWYTATAGNGTYAVSSGEAVGDICPAGWRIAKGSNNGEYKALVNTYGGSANLRSFPANFTLPGEYSGNSAAIRGTEARFWSSTAQSANNAYRAKLTISAVDSSGNWNKTHGMYVRCIAVPDWRTIVYNANVDGQGGSGASGEVTNLPPAQTISVADNVLPISDLIPIRQGYVFAGWDTDPSATVPTYPTGQDNSYQIDQSTGRMISLYAIWETNTMLDAGPIVNMKLKKLAGASGDPDMETEDNNIVAFARANELPGDLISCDANTPDDRIISVPGSTKMICISFDSNTGTMYYYSEEEGNIYANRNSSGMFRELRALARISDIGYWNTSKVVNMSEMFNNAGYDVVDPFSIDVSNWDTSAVTSMRHMFSSAGRSATSFSIDLSDWDTSMVRDTAGMFANTGYSATDTWSIGDLSDWDTAKVTTMADMFYNAGRSAASWSVGDLSEWDISAVTNMYRMFYAAGYSASVFTLDLSGWDTSKVTNMYMAFRYAGREATTWSIGDLSEWDVSQVTNMGYIFNYAGYKATDWSLGNLSKWDTSKVAGMHYMFHSAGREATTWSIGNLSRWNTSAVTMMHFMFYDAGRNATTWSIGDLSGWDTSKVTNMNYMFAQAGYREEAWSIGNLSDWDTSEVTNMAYTFQNAGHNTATFSLDLTNWDTSKVTSMHSMFASAGNNAKNSWSIGDLSGWDTSEVTDMAYMFYDAGCNVVSTWSIGDLSGWDTSKVTTMNNMFHSAGYKATGAWSLGDLSGWDTSKVTDMGHMFSGTGHEATTWFVGGLSGWDTSEVTDMSYMFYDAGHNATTFSLDLSGWNTSKVTEAGSTMFSSAGYSATTWTVIISPTNGGNPSINNDTTHLYGSTSSTYAPPASGRQFTIARTLTLSLGTGVAGIEIDGRLVTGNTRFLAEGSVHTINMVFDSGYEFDSWAVSGTGVTVASTSANPTTITIGAADATLTANAAQSTSPQGSPQQQNEEPQASQQNSSQQQNVEPQVASQPVPFSAPMSQNTSLPTPIDTEPANTEDQTREEADSRDANVAPLGVWRSSDSGTSAVKTTAVGSDATESPSVFGLIALVGAGIAATSGLLLLTGKHRMNGEGEEEV